MSEHKAGATYRTEEVRGWLEQLSEVVQFDFDQHLEQRPELRDGIHGSHDLDEDGEFWIEYSDPDSSLGVTPSRLRDFAEAYTSGRLSERRRLRLNDRTWFLLEPLNESARALEHIDSWNRDLVAIPDRTEDKWRVWLERGLTPFAFALLREGGLERDYMNAFYDQQLFAVVGHANGTADDEVEEIVSKFLFELAANSGILLRATDYPTWDDEAPETPTVHEKPFSAAYRDGDLVVRSLPTGPGATELSRLWLRGKYVDDPASALLTYIRVIEFVSATVSRQESHLRLRLLLKAQDAVSLHSDFLDQVLNESERFVRIRRSDADLVRLTIQTCCVPSLLALRTSSVLPAITQGLKREKESDREGAMAEFARIIYATRNSLVHAKSNYTPTGGEVAEEDLPALLPAVEHAALMAVRWFLEQPAHSRVI